MVSITHAMPRPLGLAAELATSFFLIPGGLALYLALLYVVTGQDPVPPVSHFLVGSTAALLPFAAFLSVVWVYYVVAYVTVGAQAHYLLTFARVPDWLVEFLSRRVFSSQQGSTLPIHLIPSFSPVRLHRRHPPGLQAMGWRAGDSAQLE